MSEPNSSRWLEVLSTAECHEYLQQERLGRVGVSIRSLPVILPVLYSAEDNAIWFFTEEGTKLDSAVSNTVVAFEVDHLDLEGGWSVLVIGQSREETDPVRVAAMREAGLVAGAPGSRDHLISIPIGHISGRRFVTDSRAKLTPGYN